MRNPLFLFGIFAAIGIPCLMLSGYFAYTTSQKVNSWETQDGVIAGFNQGNYPIITFDYGGKPYEFESSYTSSDMESEQPVTVFFPPNEPNKAEIKSFFSLWFLPLFLSIFGIIFGGIGVVGFMVQKNKADAKNELFVLQKGKKLSLPNAKVVWNTSYKVNGVSPFVISVPWLDPISNLMYTFTSDNIWYDPSQVIADKQQIDVYIDQNNPKRYYVDITFLPKSAN